MRDGNDGQTTRNFPPGCSPHLPLWRDHCPPPSSPATASPGHRPELALLRRAAAALRLREGGHRLRQRRERGVERGPLRGVHLLQAPPHPLHLPPGGPPGTALVPRVALPSPPPNSVVVVGDLGLDRRGHGERCHTLPRTFPPCLMVNQSGLSGCRDWRGHTAGHAGRLPSHRVAGLGWVRPARTPTGGLGVRPNGYPARGGLQTGVC